jgi:putative hydrolases of HD superfamily
MDDSRLRGQLDFIYEVDKIKNILRKTKLFDGARFENDAEHSWTICLMAILLREYADFGVDVERVVGMLLIHDIVEIDAGDTFLYSAERADAAEREKKAAKRIFGMLEEDQSEELFGLWAEFEARETNEAKFAAVFDRIEPILQNYRNEGVTWKQHKISKAMVIDRNKHIAEASKEIWRFLLALLDECEAKGFFPA